MPINRLEVFMQSSIILRNRGSKMCNGSLARGKSSAPGKGKTGITSGISNLKVMMDS
jgi:hypothetical protein